MFFHCQIVSMPNSIAISCLYILFKSESLVVFTLANNFLSFMYIRWLNFPWDFEILLSPVHFLSTWLNGIVAIMNRNGKNESPWKISLWIFISAMVYLLGINSILQVSVAFVMKSMILSDILNVFRDFLSKFFGPCHLLFCTPSIATSWLLW